MPTKLPEQKQLERREEFFSVANMNLILTMYCVVASAIAFLAFTIFSYPEMGERVQEIGRLTGFCLYAISTAFLYHSRVSRDSRS